MQNDTFYAQTEEDTAMPGGAGVTGNERRATGENSSSAEDVGECTEG